LDAITSKCKILLNCVGPYFKFGEPVIKSCIKTSCNYLDITGEPNFIKLCLKYDEEAKKQKIVIINCCGFDSIPVDLGSFYTLQQFPENERDDVQISGFLKASGKPSYGTWSTLMYSLTNQFSLFYRKKTRIK